MKKYKNKNVRNELLRECYNKLNEGAFENKLPKDMKLIWNSKLTATGGYCKNSIKDQTSQIELSTKVCDTPERMRDVLAHEMCHAATFLLNGILDGHGSIWKNWAARVNFTFKQIPKITVYHSYQIKKKFIYKCQRCLSE
jgi:predicted SprT family Zn-dependent metalloprotease